jgi:hypothetical protein
MLMTLMFTALLAAGLYAVVRWVGSVYPVYGTLSQVTFYGVTALYLWHLLVRGRR